jgi:hypothetical protein
MTITLTLGPVQLSAELNSSPTAAALAAMLPVTLRLSRWGEEYYGALPHKLDAQLAADAREEMEVGELAYWPPGNALCLFFGPTPASEDKRPRAASPVNPLGTFTGDLAALKRLGATVKAAVARQQGP